MSVFMHGFSMMHYAYYSFIVRMYSIALGPQTRMPRVAAHLHFRNIDVSSLSELCRRWYKHEHGAAPRKVMAHTALSDIRESIQELRYYREAIFKRPK